MGSLNDVICKGLIVPECDISSFYPVTRNKTNYCDMFRSGIKKVIFHDPATIVYWHDGTKTVVKCMKGKKFDPEKGLAMAIAKKYFGNNNTFHKVFKDWLPKGEI